MATENTTTFNTNSQTASDLITIKYASSLLRVHPETIRRYIREGKLKAFKIGSSESSPIRISYADFELFIQGEKE